MADIYTLISDSDLSEELANCIRNRNIEQKFVYQGTGASLYYKQKHNNKMYNNQSIDISDIIDFYKNNLESKNHDFLISLGCGNSEIEQELLKNIQEIDYIGVDSSQKMLDLSIKNLTDIKNKKLIRADFSSNRFRQELRNITESSNNRIFAFFSNTFGNIQHTNIIDILQNLLKNGEKIWIDVRIRDGESVKSDLDISNFFLEELEREEIKNSYLHVLKQVGLKESDGKLILKTSKVEFLNALKFEFFFKVNKKIIINFKGEKIIILPGEQIKVQQVYSYSKDGLINFFQEHGFKLIDKQIKGYRGQFLFEKR